MAARTVVCPECSEKLPYGRLSCPACGSLLAAVTGGPVRAVAPQPSPPAAVPAPGPAPEADEALAARPRRRWRARPNGAAAEEPQVPVATGVAPAPPRPQSAAPVAGSKRTMLAPSRVGAVTLAARLDVTPPPALPPAAPAALGDWQPADHQALGGPSPWRRDGVQRPRDEADDAVVGKPGGVGPTGASNGNGAHVEPRLPAWAGGPRAASTPPLDWPAAATPIASGEAPKVPPPPGAYLPPSGAFTARDSGLPRGQLVQPGATRVSPAPATRAPLPAASPSLAAAERDPRPSAGSAPLLGDLSFGAPTSLPGWLVAAGCAAAIAGFLLPWSRMIPGQGGFGYLDTWGLASSSRLLVLLLTMVTLALAILPNRAPAWLRTGVAGLVLGGLLLGLVWPYLLDGASAIGTLAEAAAALLLIVGGLLAVRPERHAEVEPAV